MTLSFYSQIARLFDLIIWLEAALNNLIWSAISELGHFVYYLFRLIAALVLLQAWKISFELVHIMNLIKSFIRYGDI